MLAEKTIRKHVAIIHAYSLMSMLQRKIVNVLFYEAIKGNNRQKESQFCCGRMSDSIFYAFKGN